MKIVPPPPGDREVPPVIKAASYQDRAGTDCVMLADIEGQVCWGGVRFSSHSCYLCRGHANPPDYLPEPVARPREEVDALIAAQQAKTKQTEADREAKYQAGRWFRPYETELKDGTEVPIGPFWTDLTDVMLLFLHSMLGTVQDPQMVMADDPRVVQELRRLGRVATAEVYRRDLEWPNEPYTLQMAPDWVGTIDVRSDSKYANPFGERLLRLGLHHLSDMDLHLIRGASAWVADYSGLERGTRQLVQHTHGVTYDELKRRKIEPEFLSNLKLD